jgi:hypothetical protein
MPIKDKCQSMKVHGKTDRQKPQWDFCHYNFKPNEKERVSAMKKLNQKSNKAFRSCEANQTCEFSQQISGGGGTQNG